MISNIASVRRQVKNVAYNYSDAQVKVREATSNDPWGAPSTLMSEIADMTYNSLAFTEIMQMIWKRLNDHGKNWRHVYKSLVLLDYMIKTGSDKVAQQCKENIYAIQTLKDFQFIEDNKDHGLNVREKAKHLVALLKDDERLKTERARALQAKKRFAQNGTGFGTDGLMHTAFHHGDSRPTSTDDGMVTSFTTRTRRGLLRNGVSVPDLSRHQSELEEARPTSPGEEELQLQIALALSREEAQKEDEARKGMINSDDIRLQMALSESREYQRHQSVDGPVACTGSSKSQLSNGLDELLAFGPTTHNQAARPPLLDPWGVPIPPPSESAKSKSLNDPWCSSPMNVSEPQPVEPFDPWTPAPTQTQRSDPWNSIAPSTAADDPGRNALFTNDANANVNTTASLVDSRRQMKTPESFLGENSSLVNLDNLMGMGQKQSSSATAKSSTNPFMNSNSQNVNATAAPTVGSTHNPFLIQQRPSPTLNQMRTSQSVSQPNASLGSTSVPLSGGEITNGSGAWDLPQPLQPLRSASTNPFL